MKELEPSEVAISEGQKMARATFEKRGERGYQTTVTLREDELAALLARAYDAGQKGKTR
jgi:hypothetical protein